MIPLDEAEMEHYLERAAIMEIDGGLSRKEAERYAMFLVVAERVAKQERK